MVASLGSRRVRWLGKQAELALAADVYEFQKAGAIPANATRIVLDGGVLVAVEWEATTYFAGVRPWLTCPRCSTRRRLLYERDGVVACRECAGTTYASRVKVWPSARMLRHAVKLRRRLGVAEAPFSELPPCLRQHHMARKWYTRIVREIEACEREALGMFTNELRASRRPPKGQARGRQQQRR
jgi:hypothetical protein